jgi:glutathione S-transferase
VKIWGDSKSGNCFKIKHLCAELDIAYEWEEVDILARATHTPEFLAMNPNGKIPVVDLGGGLYLAESNAILAYLAEGSPLGGTTRYERGLVLQWMFFEQYSHEPNIATSRFIIRYLGNPPDRQAALADKQAAGQRALGILERQLAGSEFMVGKRFTLADIALFAYTHVAEEGGFDLGPYKAVRAWIGRVASRPRFVPMNAAG